MSSQIKVAFVGNPNCGKTTLFNAYTGAKHKVGNWPGVTVEKKEGTIKHDDRALTLVDLPGIYSISPYSMEEILTREYILNDDPDVVVNIVNASNLERNLYLTLQLMELGKPVIIALNMIDVAENRGSIINIKALENELGIPIIPVIATKKKGLNELIHGIIKIADKNVDYKSSLINYGQEIEDEIKLVEDKISNRYEIPSNTLRWYALKTLERDKEVLNKLDIEYNKSNYEEEIAKTKYDYISCFINKVLTNTMDDDDILSDKIDKVVTNKWLGIPIFLSMMFIVFAFTFNVGNYLADILDQGLGILAEWVTFALTAVNTADWLISLIVDGIIGGVGGVLIFLPNIACLFLAISILEDSGYMSRVAFIMDRFMRRIGLSGKAFIPMILGFGCSVPAIMTARTLEDEKDRLTTILISPFMSCSARLPIYVLFSNIFFPGNETLITFSLYLLGILVAIIVALVFKKTLAKGETLPLILELPAYKAPSIRTMLIFVWGKVKGYIQRAGTIIFVASIVIWFVLEYNFTGKVEMPFSLGASIGRTIAPIFTPLGFGNWQAAVSLIAGILGKEIVVSSMAVIYGIGELSASGEATGFSIALINAGFTQLSAYSFMVFSLLYTPCVAALGVVKKETNSWKWTIFSFIYQLVIAWVVAGIIYQIGLLFFR